MISILTPAFNESVNLEALHARLTQTMAQLGEEWEWLIVDDHSRDDTFAVDAASGADGLARARDQAGPQSRIPRRDHLPAFITCAATRR